MDEFKISFNEFIQNNKNKNEDYLINHILHILVHHKYLSIIDNQLIYKNSLYRDFDKSSRLNDLKEYILQNCKDIVTKLIQLNLESKLIDMPKDVSTLYDKMGTTTQLDPNFDVDVNNRSHCFLYINDTLMISNYGEKHYQLINKYLHDKSIVHNSYIDAARYRDINEIKKYWDIDLPASTPIAWGHVAYGVAYIETCQNVSISTIVKKLLEELRFKKIYSYDFTNQKITRLAKHINKKGTIY